MSIYFTIRNEKEEKAKLKDHLYFTNVILEYISSQEKDEILLSTRYFLANIRSFRKKKSIESLFEDIIAVQENIGEDLSAKFSDMVNMLNLKKYIIAFLYSKRLARRTLAMKVIGCLKLHGNEKAISKYASSNNYVLRTVALDTLIRLSDTRNLQVLLSHKRLISMLDINVIVHGFENNRNTDINYLSLLESGSPRINVIGLLLIKAGNISEYKDLIRPMINSNESLLQKTALEAFTSIASTEEDLRFLTGIYKNQNTNGKILIIKSLQRESTGQFIEFLKEVISNDSVSLKIEAMRILFRNNIDSFILYENSSDRNILAAYNEIVDLNLI
jgi:hypothetical protein